MSEPILDVVRGLSSVASFAIVITQLKNVYLEVFTNVCENCRGCGRMICPHCHGTKDMRRLPAQLLLKEMDNLVDGPDDHYACVHCGPPTIYDFQSREKPLPDNEPECYQIMDNMKAALANKPRPRPFRNWAGTVPCGECGGQSVIWRHTPNMARVFNFEEPLHFRISKRAGRWSNDRTAARPRDYLEYPSRPPMIEEKHPLQKLLLDEQSYRKKTTPSGSVPAEGTFLEYAKFYIDDELSDDEGVMDVLDGGRHRTTLLLKRRK